jgi:hypothetical protein
MILRNTLFVFSFFSLFLQQGLAQSPPFWTENFTNGFPINWSNADASGQNAFWTWCSTPDAGNNEAGCPSIFNDAINVQSPFAASTATTGFLTLDSDEYGQLDQNHISQLTTSAINCTGKSEVWMTYQTHIGVYQHDASTDALVRVSIDSVNWTTVQTFFHTDRWSKNPEYPILDLSAVAANSSKVYIQWEWNGNWDYQWNLDDIELYDKNPTPTDDIAISSFFYPPSSFATPASQIASDTFGFYLVLSNKGLNPQTNVKMKVSVENELGFLLHSDSLSFPNLSTGIVDSLFAFNQNYIPNLVEGKYMIKYSVKSSETDLRPLDNVAEDFFLVTANQFAKEDGANQAFRPAGNPDPYYVGNYYKMNAGALDAYKAISMEFAFTTDSIELELGNVEATTYFLRLNDDIDAGLTNLDPAEFLGSFSLLGLSDYNAPDTLEDDYVLQTVDLIDFNTSEAGILLEPGGRYMVAVGYSGVNSNTFHAFNNAHNYYFTSTLIYADDWFTFGTDANAVIRLNISLVSTIDEKPLAEKAFNVFPNPASDLLKLAYLFEKPTDATITIADVTGKVISIQDKSDLTQGQLDFSVKNLVSGLYLARIATKEGSKTVKFVVE